MLVSKYDTLNRSMKDGTIHMDDLYLLPVFEEWMDKHHQQFLKLTAEELFFIWRSGVRVGLDIAY